MQSGKAALPRKLGLEIPNPERPEVLTSLFPSCSKSHGLRVYFLLQNMMIGLDLRSFFPTVIERYVPMITSLQRKTMKE
jgi:hypothetical protein